MCTPPVVLTIAGFDPSSGAGITADIKTIAAHGCYGVSCITALTVQSTQGVRRVIPTSSEVVRETLHELAADMPISAVHIGMLGSGEVAAEVAEFLTGLKGAFVVLDPILRSSSGADLLDGMGREVLQARLLPLATVVTPNLREAEVLTGIAAGTVDQMRKAAKRLHELGARAVVIKGGHLEGTETVELLSVAGMTREYRGSRINSRATHGTGCAFASSLACNLAKGEPLETAVGLAKEYVATAIQRAYPLGLGHGPMNHLFRL